MKTIAIMFAATLFTACTVEPNDTSTASQALDGDSWICRQDCANGDQLIGVGRTPDEAYQDLPGCGAGGGPIYCNQRVVLIAD